MNEPLPVATVCRAATELLRKLRHSATGAQARALLARAWNPSLPPDQLKSRGAPTVVRYSDNLLDNRASFLESIASKL